MKIADRHVAHGLPPYVIAELGVNHDGSVERALALVDQAAGTGADAVKLQCFRAELLMSRASKLARYQEDAGERDPVSMLSRLELGLPDMARVIDRARARRLHAIVTVFSVELVGEAGALGWDAFKTASPDIINRPLLDALAAAGRPLILSTGAATEAEVVRAVEWLVPAFPRLAVLQCVSSYPASPEDAALAGIGRLRDICPVPVGYSDHTPLIETGAMAVAAGACVLEKHLTYDRGAPGPDHAASLDPAQFRRYVELARLAHTMLGPEAKRVQACEEDVRTVSRQSLTTTRSLPAGHTVTRADLTIKRPGKGLEPWMLGGVIGRRLVRAVGDDTPLVAQDLEPM
jgi:N-acetylneuraminate synthase/N,N'-diacetyllegionaminate synthase